VLIEVDGYRKPGQELLLIELQAHSLQASIEHHIPASGQTWVYAARNILYGSEARLEYRMRGTRGRDGQLQGLSQGHYLNVLSAYDPN
jgi:hypothetical protein